MGSPAATAVPPSSVSTVAGRMNDVTGEVSPEELERARMLEVTADPEAIRRAAYLIVAVPTPVNEARPADCSPLESASEIVGRYMKKGAIVG